MLVVLGVLGTSTVQAPAGGNPIIGFQAVALPLLVLNTTPSEFASGGKVAGRLRYLPRHRSLKELASAPTLAQETEPKGLWRRIVMAIVDNN